MATKDGKKTGGRKKGTPNKRTLDLADKFEQFDYCPVTTHINIIKEQQAFYKEWLDPKTSTSRKKLLSKLMMPMEDFAKINLDSFNYLFPKRKAVEVKKESSGTIKFVTQDEFNEVKE